MLLTENMEQFYTEIIDTILCLKINSLNDIKNILRILSVYLHEPKFINLFCTKINFNCYWHRIIFIEIKFLIDDKFDFVSAVKNLFFDMEYVDRVYVLEYVSVFFEDFSLLNKFVDDMKCLLSRCDMCNNNGDDKNNGELCTKNNGELCTRNNGVLCTRNRSDSRDIKNSSNEKNSKDSNKSTENNKSFSNINKNIKYTDNKLNPNKLKSEKFINACKFIGLEIPYEKKDVFKPIINVEEHEFDFYNIKLDLNGSNNICNNVNNNSNGSNNVIKGSTSNIKNNNNHYSIDTTNNNNNSKTTINNNIHHNNNNNIINYNNNNNNILNNNNINNNTIKLPKNIHDQITFIKSNFTDLQKIDSLSKHLKLPENQKSIPLILNKLRNNLYLVPTLARIIKNTGVVCKKYVNKLVEQTFKQNDNKNNNMCNRNSGYDNKNCSVYNKNSGYLSDSSKCINSINNNNKYVNNNKYINNSKSINSINNKYINNKNSYDNTNSKNSLYKNTTYKNIHTEETTLTRSELINNLLLITELSKFKFIQPQDIFLFLDTYYKNKDIELFCLIFKQVGRFYLSDENTNNKIREYLDKIIMYGSKCSQVECVYINDMISSVFPKNKECDDRVDEFLVYWVSSGNENYSMDEENSGENGESVYSRDEENNISVNNCGDEKIVCRGE
ncbi:hypothetical protein NAPIS_ORF02536 [Vairimorpha apis BRL 01]|uniref:Uncharacterized protein n=1 Tax=Vairimorpha apis BRL 01 TaxID=1037528 RepID=T0MFS2_9MICR|nr:hypothetical protein NAPIS_ORF02536 [Vairimorpha apis BRL 01]